jgi:hypothetical protein
MNILLELAETLVAISKRIRTIEALPRVTIANDLIWKNKGDTAVGTGLNTAVVLPLGIDAQVLTVNSSLPNGVEWADASSGGHIIEGNYVPFPQQPILNFSGSGVTVADDPGNTLTTVDILPPHDIYDEGGSLMPYEAIIHFEGSGVAVTDDGGAGETVVTIAGGVGGDQIELNPSPADHDYSGLSATFTAHDVQGFGDACRINSTGEMAIADANGIATSSSFGLALESIDHDTPGLYLLYGFARDSGWSWTVGGLIYLSVVGTTGNTLTQVRPSGTDDVIQILGVAIDVTRIFWNPQLVQVEHV